MIKSRIRRNNLRGTDLNLLTVFEATYEEQSQVKAAERLGMTQPAVSNALGRLKHLTKDTLFYGRSNTGLQPTARANEIYAQVHRALNLVRMGLINGNEFDPSLSHRHFSIAISYGGGAAVAAPLYRYIRQQAPNSRITIRAIDIEKEVSMLLRDQGLDVILHYEKYIEPSLVHELIYQHQTVLVVNRDHPRIREAPTSAQIMNENFVVVYGPYPFVVGESDELFADINERVVLQVPNVMTLLQVIEDSDLLAFTTQQFVHTFKNKFNIVSYPVPWQVENAPLYMIWHRSVQLDSGHKWLRTQVKQIVQDFWIPPDDTDKLNKDHLRWRLSHAQFTGQ
ncbi:LysR substrate-binding domain-containing protein [Candidatus Methylospira mobilis]|uniref:LysR substrate-binding domain-containing protein n=1 Tax=Candidatus Methylospira mobilis TaxID=1808979 RepID=UPI0028EB4198|nr:LysR substrate-binding domain-containing protein [Candidatus Methylospira mobilis]WNV06607.1 LysR substrate-binding domain-containing protein [Candidatus Methylospira mobilis]